VTAAIALSAPGSQPAAVAAAPGKPHMKCHPVARPTCPRGWTVGCTQWSPLGVGLSRCCVKMGCWTAFDPGTNKRPAAR
jgi:hypothetical protein